jgi:hypothetical protein
MRIRRLLKLYYELTWIGLTIGMMLLVVLLFLRKQPARLRLQAFSLGLPTWELPEMCWNGCGSTLLSRVYALLFSVRWTPPLYLLPSERFIKQLYFQLKMLPTKMMVPSALPRLC